MHVTPSLSLSLYISLSLSPFVDCAEHLREVLNGTSPVLLSDFRPSDCSHPHDAVSMAATFLQRSECLGEQALASWTCGLTAMAAGWGTATAAFHFELVGLMLGIVDIGAKEMGAQDFPFLFCVLCF